MFKVELIGNLGADAEIKEANGSKFVAMRVAHTEKWKDDNGEEHKSTIWADVTISNHESKVIPFLKQGVKVFVRGNASLRVYSSQKEKRIMAGIKVAAVEIELCGGVNELVPNSLIDPDSGALHDVRKYYWCDADTKGMKKDDLKNLVDNRGKWYLMNNLGFVSPVPEQSDENGASGEDANNTSSDKS